MTSQACRIQKSPQEVVKTEADQDQRMLLAYEHKNSNAWYEATM
jgi:hypothetical protein